MTIIPWTRLSRGAGWFLPAGLLFLALGCASSSLQSAAGPSGLDRAREKIAKEDYRDAVVLLNEFLRENPGTRYLDEATFLLGKAYYETGEYLEAETRFRSILRDFPESAFAPDASYHLGLALLSQSRGPELDQTETLAARQQFESFLRRYPDHAEAPRAREHVARIEEKLAHKEFLNARTYLRRGYEDAAIYYLEKKVVADYPESTWADQAVYQLFDIYRKRYGRAHAEMDRASAVRWGREALARAGTSGPADDIKRFLAAEGVSIAADSTGSQ